MLKKLVTRQVTARGDEQPDQGSLAGASMHEIRALAEAYSPSKVRETSSCFWFERWFGDGLVFGMGSGARG